MMPKGTCSADLPGMAEARHSYLASFVKTGLHAASSTRIDAKAASSGIGNRTP
jgi:hypothetical protein